MNISVRHTFPVPKSSNKTKTVLTMSDMTESTELQAFKRQKDGYKVTVKISLCICVVLSWDELKVRQNLLDSDYEMYMVRLLVATVNWHKSLQFAKKSNITLLSCLFMILLAVSMITLIILYHILARFEFQFIYLLYLIISCMTSVTQKFKDKSTSEIPRDGFFSLFAWHLEKPFRNYCIQKTKMSRFINDSFASWSQFDWQATY